MAKTLETASYGERVAYKTGVDWVFGRLVVNREKAGVELKQVSALIAAVLLEAEPLAELPTWYTEAHNDTT